MAEFSSFRRDKTGGPAPPLVAARGNTRLIPSSKLNDLLSNERVFV
jgi:hypothetical protein